MQKPAVEYVAKILSCPMMLCCVMQMVKSINYMLIESRSFSNQKKGLCLTKKLFKQVCLLVKIQRGPLVLMLNDSARWKSEITEALKSVCSGYSNNSSSDINEVFSTMFPDSKIAQIFQLGPDKLKYYYNLGIVPYLKDVFKEMLKKSDLYVVCFDESLNDVARNCQMDVLIRYFDSVDRKVKM